MTSTVLKIATPRGPMISKVQAKLQITRAIELQKRGIVKF